MTNHDWTFENGNVVRKKNDGIDGQQTLGVQPDGTLDVVSEIDLVERAPIVDETGVAANEEVLSIIKAGNYDQKYLIKELKTRTKAVLTALSELQSNDNPLKKGGEGIAFRCDTIIHENRQHYNVPQNTVLDIIMALMSTYPDEVVYEIKIKDTIDLLPYGDDTYAYKIFSRTCEELAEKPFIFDIGGEPIKQYLFETIAYRNANSIKKDEETSVYFVPTDFFRVLTNSATIMHGSFYNVKVAAQISSKYVRNLYYYLQSMKSFKEYPNATPGRFKLSLDELQYIVCYPSSYRTTDIRRFVLDEAVDKINSLEGCDFSFQYEFIKTGKDGGKKKITHVQLIISTTYTIAAKEEPVAIEEKEDDTQLSQVLAGFGFHFSEAQYNDIINKYKKHKRDMEFFVSACASVLTNTKVDDRCALLCHIMEHGLNESLSAEKNMERNEKRIKPEKKNYTSENRKRTQRYKDLFEASVLRELTPEEKAELLIESEKTVQ